MTIKLRRVYMGPVGDVTPRRQYEWLADLAEYPMEGGYTIESTGDFSGPDLSASIGAMQPPKTKIWRFRPQELCLYLRTLSQMTMGAGKGAMTAEDNPYEIVDDLVLYQVNMTNRGFEPLGNSGYAGGFVQVKSTTKPFEVRSLTWESA